MLRPLLASLSLLATPATAAELIVCMALTVPDQLGLGCRPAPELAPGAAVVAPVEGSFSALSRMVVRPLDRAGEDALAWSDPEAWLRKQMTIDTSSYADLLSGLAASPDSPFAGPGAQAALETFKTALSSVGRLALTACDDPAATAPGRWGMRCTFTAGGIGMFMHLRLVAAGEERWAVTMRAANEQRLRHFEAIANSFEPG